MDDSLCHESLTRMGLHISNSTDLEPARWLVRTAGADAVRSATHELTSRRRPRPRTVIEFLGLERRQARRPDVPAADAVTAHQLHRREGWRSSPGNATS